MVVLLLGAGGDLENDLRKEKEKKKKK